MLERDTDMPVRLTSEKFMRAERKNRLETHYLNTTYRQYDKQTVRLNYEIDREKRSITKAFRKVVKTSGASDLGVPPQNAKDNSYENCPTYRQGLKLSNKRLFEWREVEKQLNKFIDAHELEDLNEKRKKLSRKAKKKYTIIPAEADDDDEHDEVFDDIETASQTSTTSKVSPTDILKDDVSEPDEVFDVKKWEKEMINSYTNMVCKKVTVSDDSKGGKLRSKSSPSITRTNSEFETGIKSKARPHTAHAGVRSRPLSAKSLPPRPVSAHVKREEEPAKFLITKDSIFIKNGHKFEKLMDSRPVEKPLMVNNYVNSLLPVAPGPVPDSDTASVSMGSVNGLCTVQEANEEAGEEADDVSTFGYDVKSNIEIRLNSSAHSAGSGTKPMNKAKPRTKRSKSSSALSVASGSTQRSYFKHSNSDLSSYVESHRRKRRDSESTSCSTFSRAISRTGSTISSHRPSVSLGIPSDIHEISRGQDLLAAGISAEKPLATSKLISVAKVVKCAMTFSKLARARALEQMQQENSSDSHEIIRQERLRLLQSRQNVLNSIANQWQRDDNSEPLDNPEIEQVE